MLLVSGSGMAVGSWSGGALYDHFGHYGPAFVVGTAVSLLNFLIISVLAFRRSTTTPAAPAFA